MRIEHTCNRNLAYVAPLSQTPLTWLHTNTHDGTAVQRYVCLSISINYIVKVPFVSFLKPLSRLKPADLFFSFDFTVCFFGLALVPSSQIFSRRIAPLYIYICLHILWFREPVLSGPPPTKARAKIKKKMVYNAKQSKASSKRRSKIYAVGLPFRLYVSPLRPAEALATICSSSLVVCMSVC